jgi:hypothetical protein
VTRGLFRSLSAPHPRQIRLLGRVARTRILGHRITFTSPLSFSFPFFPHLAWKVPEPGMLLETIASPTLHKPLPPHAPSVSPSPYSTDLNRPQSLSLSYQFRSQNHDSYPSLQTIILLSVPFFIIIFLFSS